MWESTLEGRADDKFVCTMPYEEEEDRVCEVKCPKCGGDYVNGATPISLPKKNDHRQRAMVKKLTVYAQSQKNMRITTVVNVKYLAI